MWVFKPVAVTLGVSHVITSTDVPGIYKLPFCIVNVDGYMLGFKINMPQNIKSKPQTSLL